MTLLGFGAVAAIWAASGGVTAVMRALNTAYDVKEGRPFWKVRGIAILMTLIAGALGLVAALVAIAAAPIAEAIGGPIGAAITWLRLPVAGLVMMFLWAIVYYVLPDVEQRFRFITPGSVFGVLVWVLASGVPSTSRASAATTRRTGRSPASSSCSSGCGSLARAARRRGGERAHRAPLGGGKRQGAKRKSDTGTAGRDAPGEGADPQRRRSRGRCGRGRRSHAWGRPARGPA